jgi:succinate dehydrogenase / fumarate reductase cytochrome b subunit
MALTGLVLVFFVIGHLLGNLQVFLGPEALNAYGAFLHSVPELLWPARIVIVGSLVLHIWCAIRLSKENRAARPVGYSTEYKPVKASYASRTMLMSGLILFSFIVYHILHFTVEAQWVNLTGRSFEGMNDAKGRHDVFAMMVLGFRQPIVAVFYVISMALLCLHLSHGVSSLFQSLGLRTRPWSPLIDKAGLILAWALFLGYASIPISILLGYGASYVGKL